YYNLRRYRRYNARRRRVRSFCQDVCYYSLSTRKPRSSREAVGRLRYKRCQIDHTRHQHNTDMSHGGCATADAVSRTDEDGRIHMRTTLFAVVATLAILAHFVPGWVTSSSQARIEPTAPTETIDPYNGCS